jgi:hypothetical protein
MIELDKLFVFFHGELPDLTTADSKENFDRKVAF